MVAGCWAQRFTRHAERAALQSRATQIVDTYPYQEIVIFCKIHRDRIDDVFRTLSYFDGMNFAARATAPALFSTALMDDICPPSTVFAAYNHYAGQKDIRVYPFNKHEGGAMSMTDRGSALLAPSRVVLT